MACLEGMLKREKMQTSLLVGSRKWENLNVDILQKIFNGVPFSNLCDNISLVCHSWRVGSLHTILPVDLTVGVDKSIRLMRLLKTMMEGKDGYECSLEQWRSSIRKIDIPEYVEISDEHLLYIAERTVGVDTIYLCNCSMISGKGFGKALYNWKIVNSLFLEKVRFQYVAQFVEEIYKNYAAFGWLLVWNHESGGLKKDDVHGIVQHLSNEVKMMMKVEHWFMCEDGGFVIAFSCKSSEENWSVSGDDEPSKIADSLPSSFALNITLTSRKM